LKRYVGEESAVSIDTTNSGVGFKSGNSINRVRMITDYREDDSRCNLFNEDEEENEKIKGEKAVNNNSIAKDVV
jgi:hypothetical protein